MLTRYCEYCGKDIHKTDVFCPHCGSNPIAIYPVSAQTMDLGLHERKSAA